MKTKRPIILLAAADAKGRRFRGVAYTGGIMKPENWPDSIIDIAGLTIPPSLTLLDSHHNETKAVAGHVTASASGGQIIVEGTFAKGETGERIQGLVADGVPLQLSLGAKPERVSRILAGETVKVNGRTITPDHDVLLIERASLFEVSVLPHGADENTQINIAARRRKVGMNFKEWLEKHAPNAGTVSAERRRQYLLAAADDGVMFTAAEAADLVEARQMDDPHHDADRLRRTALGLMRSKPHLKQEIHARYGEAVTAGWTPTQFELEVEALEPGRGLDNSPRAGGAAAVTGEILECAFVLHAKGRTVAEKAYDAETATRAEALRCRSTHDVFAAAYRADGRPVPHDTTAFLRASGGPSTYDIGSIVAGGIEKIALMAYRNLKPTWPLYANKLNVSNFKEFTAIRLNHLGQFEIVAPGGEIKHGSIHESKYSIQADTRGKLLYLDRRDVVNDDLGMLVQAAEALGRMGVAVVSQQLWLMILANAGDFFHASNGNLLTGAGSVLDVDALSSAINLLRKQTSDDGEPLDLTPRVLAVPPELEATARQIIRSTTLQRDVSSSDNAPMGNPLPEDLELAVEPRISASGYSGSSTTQWYLFSNPSDAAVNVAFLNGRESPTIESVQPPPNILGLAWRGFLDFGVGFGDAKAAVKSAGA